VIASFGEGLPLGMAQVYHQSRRVLPLVECPSGGVWRYPWVSGASACVVREHLAGRASAHGEDLPGRTLGLSAQMWWFLFQS
jgi:hypothetical protein